MPFSKQQCRIVRAASTCVGRTSFTARDTAARIPELRDIDLFRFGVAPFASCACAQGQLSGGRGRENGHQGILMTASARSGRATKAVIIGSWSAHPGEHVFGTWGSHQGDCDSPGCPFSAARSAPRSRQERSESYGGSESRTVTEIHRVSRNPPDGQATIGSAPSGSNPLQVGSKRLRTATSSCKRMSEHCLRPLAPGHTQPISFARRATSHGARWTAPSITPSFPLIARPRWTAKTGQ
jgi:hypothetical protein